MKLTAVIIFYIFLTFSVSGSPAPVITVQYPTGGRVLAVSYDSDRRVLYAVSEDSYLYALSDSGKQLWRYPLGGAGIASLTVGTDHTVYTGTASGNLVAVNPFGRKIWDQKLDGTLVGNVLSGPDGTVFAVTHTGKLYGISHLGMVRYVVSLPSEPVMAPLLNKRFLFVAGKDNRLYAYDVWGTLRWIFLFSNTLLSAACTNSVFYGGTESGTVAAVTMNGKKLWSTVIHEPVSSIVLSASGNIYCSTGKNLAALNAGGTRLWSSYGGKSLNSLAVLGEWIVTVNTGGTLSFRLFNGRAAGSATVGKPLTPLAYTSRGEIILGSTDWNIYYAGYPHTVIAHFDKTWPLKNGRSEGNRCSEGIPHRPFFDAVQTESNDFLYLKSLADSTTEGDLSRVVTIIAKRIHQTHYDRGKSFFLPMLEHLASEGITRQYHENNLLVNDFPVIRSKADALLGEAGDFRTQEVLIHLLQYEWDAYALRVLIHSIGSLGYNPENKTVHALYNYYEKTRTVYSEEYRRTILQAVGNIYRYTGTLDDEGVRLVLAVFNDSSSKQVREYALALLNFLKK